MTLDQHRSTLPAHPTLTFPDGTPVLALGLSRNGSPIWPLRGGSEDGDEGGDDDTGGDAEGDDDADDSDADKLGDAGKKALDRMKARAKAATARARAAEAERDALKVAREGKENDPEAIREAARAEARAEALSERVADKIEAKAGGRFSLDTEDVAALLMRRHDVDEFVTDGKVDTEAISEALEQLLKDKPALAAQGGKRFTGGADGGARKTDAPVKPDMNALIRAAARGGSPL